HFRLPDEFRHLEAAMRERLTQTLQRGKVELRLTVTRRQPDSASALNQDALRGMATLLQAVQQVVPAVQAPRLAEVLAWPGVQADELEGETWEAGVMEACAQALDQLQAARRSEGERLAQMMNERTRAMRDITAQIEAHMPGI